MPTTPLPACLIWRRTPMTVWGSESMCSPAGAHDAAVASLADHVHAGAHAHIPIGGLLGVEQQDIDVVHAEFAAVAVDIGLDGGGGGGVGFGEDDNLIARHGLESFAD